MLCHITDQLRHALGELDAKPIRSPLAVFPLNWLVIHVLPWPKGRANSPPEFLERTPQAWETDRSQCRRLIHEMSQRGAQVDWPVSPVFGHISGRWYGALAYKHLDHHLRQFGV
jgi:hypothetical protein